MRIYHIYIHRQIGSFRDKTSFAVNWLASSFLAGQSNNLADNALMRALILLLHCLHRGMVLSFDKLVSSLSGLLSNDLIGRHR